MLADLMRWIGPFAHIPIVKRRKPVRKSIVVLLGLLAMTRSVAAQGYPAEMIITLPEVEVRSGPTKEYQITSKLKYGDRVLVLHESKDQPGWLAIKPPPGSFSWITDKFVKKTSDNTGVVINPGAKLLPGSVLVNSPPNAASVEIGVGCQLIILGKGNVVDGVAWYPIQPWPSEVRWIPGAAVQSRQLVNNNTVNINGSTTPGLLTSATNNQWTPGNPTQMAQGNSWAVGQTASFSQTKPAAQNLTYPPRWSQVGILQRSAYIKDGQPTFVLQDARGNVLMYATCQPGMTLRDYVGRTVALYGSVNYRSDDNLRTHFMTASHVALY